mmetsp:Transcript_14872/g.32230  ORF Transcript_14872/g.32230 Transcript_14872/m.32230 type:complete len:253 (+) Transcript_14872:272-1030(+)
MLDLRSTKPSDCRSSRDRRYQIEIGPTSRATGFVCIPLGSTSRSSTTTSTRLCRPSNESKYSRSSLAMMLLSTTSRPALTMSASSTTATSLHIPSLESVVGMPTTAPSTMGRFTNFAWRRSSTILRYSCNPRPKSPPRTACSFFLSPREIEIASRASCSASHSASSSAVTTCSSAGTRAPAPAPSSSSSAGGSSGSIRRSLTSGWVTIWPFSHIQDGTLSTGTRRVSPSIITSTNSSNTGASYGGMAACTKT